MNYAVEMLCEQACHWGQSMLERGHIVEPYFSGLTEDHNLTIIPAPSDGLDELVRSWGLFQHGPWIACALVIQTKYFKVEDKLNVLRFENLADDQQAKPCICVHALSGARKYMCIHDIADGEVALGEVMETTGALKSPFATQETVQ